MGSMSRTLEACERSYSSLKEPNQRQYSVSAICNEDVNEPARLPHSHSKAVLDASSDSEMLEIADFYQLLENYSICNTNDSIGYAGTVNNVAVP